MYMLLIVRAANGATDLQAHEAMKAFTSTGAAIRAKSGGLSGCEALNDFVFKLQGDYLRSLAELQRGADQADVALHLLTFPDQPHVARFQPNPKP